jgi:DNA-binding Xre family transcriptional regulator
MTKLGEYLASKSVNKSEVSRKTGISKARLSELTINPTARLRATELYLIALSVGADPGAVLEYVCGDLKKKVKA